MWFLIKVSILCNLTKVRIEIDVFRICGVARKNKNKLISAEILKIYLCKYSMHKNASC